MSCPESDCFKCQRGLDPQLYIGSASLMNGMAAESNLTLYKFLLPQGCRFELPPFLYYNDVDAKEEDVMDVRLMISEALVDSETSWDDEAEITAERAPIVGQLVGRVKVSSDGQRSEVVNLDKTLARHLWENSTKGVTESLAWGLYLGAPPHVKAVLGSLQSGVSPTLTVIYTNPE
ncbi:hypothetical protein EV182_006206 [Spiromyces aspiralis]|uniref:Uncharacterized protein n=1 Tax=Spiromyces aspiralis TaxID=68401 RepID=A0ACC1HU43_9FUNG|nr:hypothetical protein EV182_006206 [Spiromyces aspiralis]